MYFQEVMEYLDVDVLVNTMTEGYKAFMVGVATATNVTSLFFL